MTFDLTHAFAEGYAEGQQARGGHNKWNNCVPTSTNMCLKAMGYADIPPQHIVDVEYSSSYLGYTTFRAMADYIERFVDRSLVISYTNAGDPVNALDLYGSQGFPSIFLGHSDSQGNFRTQYTGILHASPCIRFDTNFVLLNAETGSEVAYTPEQMRIIYGGALMTFHKQVTGEGMNDAQITALIDARVAKLKDELAREQVRLFYYVILDRNLTVEEDIAWKNVINGTDFDLGIVEMVQTPEATAKLTRYWDLLNNWPAYKDKIDSLAKPTSSPQGGEATVAPHDHSFTVSGITEKT